MTKDKDTLEVKIDGLALSLHKQPFNHTPKQLQIDGKPVYIVGEYYTGDLTKFTDDGLMTYHVGVFATGADIKDHKITSLK